MREEQESSSTSNQAQEVLVSYNVTQATTLILTVSASPATLPVKLVHLPRTLLVVLATLGTIWSGSDSHASTVASLDSMAMVQPTCVSFVTTHAKLAAPPAPTCARCVLLVTLEGRACVSVPVLKASSS
jgi:hypothetical protein